jgi:hypothetical protein
MARPGWHQPAIDLLEEALVALPEEDSAIRSRVLAALGVELFFTSYEDNRRTEGAITSRGAVEMARRVGDDEALAFALASCHIASFDPDRLDDRLSVATELIDVAGRIANVELVLTGHIHRACDLLELARVDETRAEAEICEALVEELSQPVHRYFVVWLQSTIALLEGRLDDAEALSNDALQLGLAANHPDAIVVAGAQAVVIGWHRGNLDHLVQPAKQLLEDLPDLLSWRGPIALVMAMSGHVEDAEMHLRAVTSDLDTYHFSSNRKPTFIALVEVARMIGVTDVAPALYERLTPYAGTLSVVSLNLSEMGPVSRSLGALATMMGDFDAAGHHLDDALATSVAINAPPHEARACVDYARMLLERKGPGDVDRARAFLDRAQPLATRIGMAGLLADIGELSRRLPTAEPGGPSR